MENWFKIRGSISIIFKTSRIMKVSRTIFPQKPSNSFNEWQEEIRKERLARLVKEASDLRTTDLIELKMEIEKLLVNKIKG